MKDQSNDRGSLTASSTSRRGSNLTNEDRSRGGQRSAMTQQRDQFGHFIGSAAKGSRAGNEAMRGGDDAMRARNQAVRAGDETMRSGNENIRSGGNREEDKFRGGQRDSSRRAQDNRASGGGDNA